MKRIISNLMLVAAAAMAFFACQKQEVNAPEEVKVEGLNFSAEKPEFADASKTEWTGSEIHWSKGDAIRVAYTCDGVWQNAAGTATAGEEDGQKTAKLYESTTLAAASATAKFAVPGNFKGTASGVYEFYAIYPSGAAVKEADFPFAPSVTVDIPAEQTPLANSFDSAADLMAAKSVETFEGLPTERISLLWTRMVAHGHLTIKNLQVEDGEKLQRIKLTADEDADMVGQYYLYLDTYNVEKASGNNAANSLTVKADNLTIAEGGNVTFWTCFLPCTWKSLDVVVETDKATYTRSIDLTGNEKTFAQNARNTLAINMATAERVAKTALSLPFVRDFSDRSGSSEITELDGFSSIDGKVYNADEAIRLASGNDDGSITTQPLDLSQNFHVIVTACGWDSGELKMTVSAGEQTENITLTTYGASQKPGTWKDYVINFDPVGPTASVQFSAVKDTRYYIQKIQILEGHAELTPVLSATNPDEMSAEGGEGSFTYTLSNPKEGEEVSATVNVDWIENLAVNQEAKTVSYNVAENTSEESRTATITLSYDGAQSVNVTVTQEGKPAEGGDTTPKFVKVTATPADWSGTYLIVCETQDVAFNGSLTTLDATNNVVSVTIQNDEIAYSDALNSSTFVVAKNGESYTIQSASGYYIGRDATSNGLNANTSTKYTNTITLSSGNTTITGKGGLNLRYNKNSDQKRFRYYTSAQTEIQLYKLVGGESGGDEPEVPASPVLTVTNELSEIGADGDIATIQYSLENPVEGKSVTATSDVDWINTFDYSVSGEISFIVDANETTLVRLGEVVLSYEGAESKTVTVKQAAAETTEPEEPEGETVEVTDVLTLTGLNVGTYNSYTSWSGKSFVSSAVYAGVSYNSNSSIQLKNGSNSGIVTTASGGTLKKVVVSWHSGTTAGRYITIYGSNTPYSSTSDLYGDKKGTSLGTIKCGTSTELVISGDYKYLGILASSPVYLPEIKVTWEASASTGGETPDPEPSGNIFSKFSGDLTEGDYIIVYSGRAMKAAVSSDRLNYSDVSTSNDEISEPAADIIWHIAKSGDHWTIYNESTGKYAAATGTKNQAALSSTVDDKSLWTASGTSTYEFVNKNNKAKSVNANLRNNGTYGFACYATGTGGALTLYRLN